MTLVFMSFKRLKNDYLHIHMNQLIAQFADRFYDQPQINLVAFFLNTLSLSKLPQVCRINYTKKAESLVGLADAVK